MNTTTLTHSLMVLLASVALTTLIGRYSCPRSKPLTALPLAANTVDFVDDATASACCSTPRRPTDSDGAPAFSGVEVVSTEHYDIAIDDGEEDTTATATKGVREDGSTDASLQFSGPEGCGADAEAGGGREAHVTAAGPGVGGPDILIRPPRYGFNNKVGS